MAAEASSFKAETMSAWALTYAGSNVSRAHVAKIDAAMNTLVRDEWPFVAQVFSYALPMLVHSLPRDDLFRNLKEPYPTPEMMMTLSPPTTNNLGLDLDYVALATPCHPKTGAAIRMANAGEESLEMWTKVRETVSVEERQSIFAALTDAYRWVMVRRGMYMRDRDDLACGTIQMFAYIVQRLEVDDYFPLDEVHFHELGIRITRPF